MKWNVPPSGLIDSLSCRPVAHATGKDMSPAGLVPALHKLSAKVIISFVR